MVAYKSYAKMIIPKHVENFIEDEEEFGEGSDGDASARSGHKQQTTRTPAGKGGLARNSLVTRTLQISSRRASRGARNTLTSKAMVSKTPQGTSKPFSGKFPGSKIIHVNDTATCVRNQLISSIQQRDEFVNMTVKRVGDELYDQRYAFMKYA